MIKLWTVVLFLNVCGGYKLSDLKCTESNYTLRNDLDPMDLILLNSENPEQNRLNGEFISIAHNLGFNVECLNATGVEGTVCAARKYKHVINLLVSDFFGYNYNDVLKENLFSIVTDTPAKSIQECKLKNVANDYHKINKYIIIEDNCKADNETIYNVRLLSKSVEDLDEIYSAILDIGHKRDNEVNGELSNTLQTKNKSSNTVLICLSKSLIDDEYKYILKKTFKDLSLRYEENDCKTAISELKSNLLAVLAQRPFESELQYSIPIFFYQSPYLLHEHKDKFPNSVIYTSSVQQMKYSIMEFLDTIMTWNKITVISDGTAYSEEFEGEIISLFDAKGVMYNVEMCVGVECNFTQALKSAWSNGSKILLINVDEEHGNNLTLAIETLQSSIDLSFFYWIVRDWPFEDLTFNNLQNVYSVYTAAKPSNSIRQSKCTQTFHQPYEVLFRNALGEGLAAINDSYNTSKFNKSLEFHKESFDRKIGQLIREKINRVQTVVYVIHATAKSSKVIMSMTVKKDIVTDKKICVKLPPITKINCLVNGNKFSKPCNNYEVVLIMLVASVLLLMLIAIIYMSNNHSVCEHSYSFL